MIADHTHHRNLHGQGNPFLLKILKHLPDTLCVHFVRSRLSVHPYSLHEKVRQAPEKHIDLNTAEKFLIAIVFMIGSKKPPLIMSSVEIIQQSAVVILTEFFKRTFPAQPRFGCRKVRFILNQLCNQLFLILTVACPPPFRHELFIQLRLVFLYK